MTTKTVSLDQLCINTIRTLSLDAIQKANSGHPGLPLGMAPAAYVLWTKFMRHNPKNPKWFGRDRFLLSGGHGSMLIYSLLHLTGYDLSMDEIKRFRQLHSKTPGHPENILTSGVEITTSQPWLVWRWALAGPSPPSAPQALEWTLAGMRSALA